VWRSSVGRVARVALGGGGGVGGGRERFEGRTGTVYGEARRRPVTRLRTLRPGWRKPIVWVVVRAFLCNVWGM